MLESWRFYSMLVNIFIGFQCNGLPHGHRVVCQVDNWDTNKAANYLDDVEPALKMCTHLMYMTAGMDPTTYKVFARQPFREIHLKGLTKVIALRKKFPNLKIMIAISAGEDEFSKMCSQATTRTIFIQSIIEFIKLHSFDGFEFRWRWPGNRWSSFDDRENLVLFSKEVRKEFDKLGLIYSIGTDGNVRMDGIDGAELSKYVHFLSIRMTRLFDFYDGVVMPNSPLFDVYEDSDTENIDKIIQILLSNGTDSSRINIEVSSMFATFLLRFDIIEPNEKVVALSGKISDSINSIEGPITNTKGWMAYHEVCEELENNKNWTIAEDSRSHLPFAADNNKLISLETEQTLGAKMKYIIDNKLGGVTFDKLEADDMKGSRKSSGGPFPVLRWIDQGLTKYSYSVYEEFGNLLKNVNAQNVWSGFFNLT